MTLKVAIYLYLQVKFLTMNTVYTLKNRLLTIKVKQRGAELCSIKKTNSNTEYMWNADPEIWQGHAPVLFPIVGALKNKTYYFENNPYQLPQHGFFRKNENVKLVESTETRLSFGLESSTETLKVYPFEFAFYVSFTLKENEIIIHHKIKNKGDKELYFSIGAHPAFKCPLAENEQYSDYSIELEQNEIAHTHQISPNGLIGEKTDLILNNSKQIPLHYGIFEKGALVFKNLKSHKAKLLSVKSGAILELSYKGWPFLGIWAKPNADFVCIEPWQGIADNVDSNQDLTAKEGIIKLEGMKGYEAEYRIRVF